MTDFTPLSALGGGALIGLAASLLLVAHGRVAGISGIYGGVLERDAPDKAYRVWFLLGMVLVGVAVRFIAPSAYGDTHIGNLALIIPAGLLVGFGTRLGNGCTSGHGVCGLSRFSGRSLAATLVFIAAGAVSVLLRRTLGGGL
jgi:hypothetical protein